MEYLQFGFHLTLDLYDCSESELNSMQNCYDILNKLTSELEMKGLIPPYIVQADSNIQSGGKDSGGYSGVIIIAESHISIHTFPKRGFVSMDLYSCKTFDYDKAIQIVKEAFKPKDIEVNKINRGTRYPSEDIY